MQNNVMTVAIKDEFVSLVDVSKEYTLKEFKDLISEVYKTKIGTKPKAVKKSKKNADTDSSDEEKSKKRVAKADKPKKKATPYNVYVGERIKALKIDKPDATAMERMKMAAAGWKNLSDDEKKAYIRTDDVVADE